ncbi:MAG TPA: hypothetical protein VGM30_09295 [Puia sp.]
MQKIFFAPRKYLAALAILSLLVINGCNKKESTVSPAPPGNETLSTVELVYQNAANPSDAGVAIWRQLDLTEVKPPDTSLAKVNLKANATYHVQVIILDEVSDAPKVDSVTPEILDRENYHLFFFQPEPVAASSVVISITTPYIPVEDGTVTSATGPYLNLSVARTDLDTNNPPLQIGLQDNFTTGAASTGSLRVVLRHQPNAKNGTYAPGSTDLDVNYQVSIQ